MGSTYYYNKQLGEFTGNPAAGGTGYFFTTKFQITTIIILSGLIVVKIGGGGSQFWVTFV